MAILKNRHQQPRLQIARAKTMTLSTVATVLVIVGTVASFGLWVFNSVESTSNADKREAVIRADVKLEIQKIRDEAHTHALIDARSSAWTLVATKRLEVLSLRNRVNDCRALPKQQSTLERSACLQYEDEFAKATQEYQKMQNDAMNASRER